MARSARLGRKVRTLRRKQNLTQRQLAERLDISASYLNLIENNKRPLPAHLLIKLAGLFDVDLKTFAEASDDRVQADVMEVLGDPLFDELELTQAEVREFSQASPGVARAMLMLYRAFLESRQAESNLAAAIEGVGEGATAGIGSAADEVSDLIQVHGNWFPELDAAAEKLVEDGGMTPTSRYGALVAHLERRHGVRVEIEPIGAGAGAIRVFDPGKRVLRLSEVLPPRSVHFQLAHQIALLEFGEVIDRIVSDQRLTHPESPSLARVSLANYFAGALLMPYTPFHAMAQAHRYDVELLGHRFRTSFEQVCHRLTTLRRPGAEGVPFHMVRVDIAGNISKRFSGSGIRFARYNAACPKWNVHAAFLTPGIIRPQVSRMPDGTTYFCFATTMRKHTGGYHAAHPIYAIGLGCQVQHARDIVYADGFDLEDAESAVPVGITCRLCERMGCEQRAFPPVRSPLKVDENARALNFFTPVSD